MEERTFDPDSEIKVFSPHSHEEYHESDNGSLQLSRVATSGNKYVHLGDKTFLRKDLLAAFGGDFNPGLHTAPRLRLGNGSPMGLMGFAVTTLVLGFINLGARGVHTNSIVLGSALFYGGFVQIVAGVWELISENTFAATVFSAYGGFWMSFSVITMSGFNIASSYKTKEELANAMGLFMLVWSLVTFFFVLCLLRSTVAMFALLFFVMLTFMMLSASQFTSTYPHLHGTSTNLTTAGGAFGLVAGFLAIYNAMGGILTPENSWFQVRPIYMPGAILPEDLK